MGQGEQVAGQQRALLHPAQPNSISKRAVQLNSYLNAFYKQERETKKKKEQVVNVNHLAGFTTRLLTSHLSSFFSSLFFFRICMDQNIYSSIATVLSGKLSWNHGRKTWKEGRADENRPPPALTPPPKSWCALCAAAPMHGAAIATHLGSPPPGGT